MSDFIGILIAIFFPYLIAKSISGKNKEDFKLIKKHTDKNEIYVGEFDKGFKILN